MKPYILVEPFCGMASLSFALMGCQPPISWMGSKRGYTRVLMELLGLSRHHPPVAFVWSDVGPNVAALATLAGASGNARDVAGWFASSELAARGDPAAGYAGEQERYDAGKCWTRPNIKGCAVALDALPLPRAPEVAAIIRTWKDEEPRALWERLKAAGWPSLMPQEEGRWLGPCEVGEVAGWLHANALSFVRDGTANTYLIPNGDGKTFTDRHGNQGHWHATTPELTARYVEAVTRWPRVAAYQGTATRMVEQLPERLDNVIAYLDPPYSGTTGYKFGGCPRSEVLRMALDLSARGATVAISEAVRLDRELGEGWTAVQIDGERKGQKLTFSVQQSEWVTMNRQPAHLPGQQQGLFGGAR